jgi:hypothetical protein
MSNFAEMYYTNSTDRLDELIMSATKKKDEINRQKVMALSDNVFIQFIADNLISCMAIVNSFRNNDHSIGNMGFDSSEVLFSFDYFLDKIPNYFCRLLEDNKSGFTALCLNSLSFSHKDLHVWLIDSEVDYLDDWAYQEFFNINLDIDWFIDILERLIISQFESILEMSKEDLYETFQVDIPEFKTAMIQMGYDPKYAHSLERNKRVEMVNSYLNYLKNKEEATSAR